MLALHHYYLSCRQSKKPGCLAPQNPRTEPQWSVIALIHQAEFLLAEAALRAHNKCHSLWHLVKIAVKGGVINRLGVKVENQSGFKIELDDRNRAVNNNRWRAALLRSLARHTISTVHLRAPIITGHEPGTRNCFIRRE